MKTLIIGFRIRNLKGFDLFKANKIKRNPMFVYADTLSEIWG